MVLRMFEHTMPIFCIVLSVPLLRFVFGQVCPDGFYGVDCSLKCSDCESNKCHLNGSCLNGCKEGWQGDNCTQECNSGFYGPACSEKCGHCEFMMCDSVTGNCSRGCEPYWSGIQCDKQNCPYGYYGEDCSLKCGFCDGVKCHSNGSCIQGCKEGFQGDNCTIACSQGHYGKGCRHKCDYCKNKKCYSNGVCPMGCEDGWRGDKCDEGCDDGRGCSQKCGACKDGKCARNGSCLNGCEDNWEGDQCTQAKLLDSAKDSSDEPEGSNSTGTMWGTSMGIIASLFVSMVALYFILIIMRKKVQVPKQEEAVSLTQEPDKSKQVAVEMAVEIGNPESRINEEPKTVTDAEEKTIVEGQSGGGEGWDEGGESEGGEDEGGEDGWGERGEGSSNPQEEGADNIIEQEKRAIIIV